MKEYQPLYNDKLRLLCKSHEPWQYETFTVSSTSNNVCLIGEPRYVLTLTYNCGVKLVVTLTEVELVQMPSGEYREFNSLFFREMSEAEIVPYSRARKRWLLGMGLWILQRWEAARATLYPTPADAYDR